MSYVITGGDEGIQINEGQRLGFLGAGLKLESFSEVVVALKKVLGDKELRIVANEENAWVKQEFKLDTWEQASATMQQQVEALADQNDLLYAGLIPFTDPKQLQHDIKGHMVRPKGIHIANKICFTLAGGEQTYNLGNYLISAEWVSEVDPKLAKKFITTQVDFFKKQAHGELEIVFDTKGELSEAVAAKNQQILEEFGFEAS